MSDDRLSKRMDKIEARINRVEKVLIALIAAIAAPKLALGVGPEELIPALITIIGGN